jgi:hypothetical protein
LFSSPATPERVDALQLDVTVFTGIGDSDEHVRPPGPADEAIDVPQALELGELLLHRPPAVPDGLNDVVDGELGTGVEGGENLVANSLPGVGPGGGDATVRDDGEPLLVDGGGVDKHDRAVLVAPEPVNRLGDLILPGVGEHGVCDLGVVIFLRPVAFGADFLAGEQRRLFDRLIAGVRCTEENGERVLPEVVPAGDIPVVGKVGGGVLEFVAEVPSLTDERFRRHDRGRAGGRE